jgi:hypothetical protein
MSDGFIGMEQHLAICLSPDEANGQSAAQLAARRLVADTAVKPGSQHMQLRLAHGALEAQKQPVIEQRWMIDPIGIADERIGQSGQFDEAVPIGIVARQPGDFQPEHKPDTAEGNISSKLGKAGTGYGAATGKSEIGVNDQNPVFGPAKLARPLRQRILPLSRLSVVLNLSGGRLPQIDNGQARQMAGRDLVAFTHRVFLPPDAWPPA